MHICDQLEADMDSPGCMEIKQHLERCTNCTEYLDSLKKTILLFRQYPDPKIPRMFHKRLFTALRVSPGGAKNNNPHGSFNESQHLIDRKTGC